jgi:hypothetical protein
MYSTYLIMYVFYLLRSEFIYWNLTLFIEICIYLFSSLPWSTHPELFYLIISCM